MGIYNEITANRWKTGLLVVLFFGLVIFMGLMVGVFYGSTSFGLILAVIIGGLYFLFSYYAGAGMILAMSHAKEAKKPEHAYLINLVEGLSIAAGLSKVPKVYVMEDSALNAFATGRNPENSAVAITTGLLSKLNRQELEGLIAHELSHIGNKDMLVSTVAVILVGFVSIIADMFLRSMFFGRRDNDRQGGGIIVMIGLILSILTPIIANLINLAISRRREFLADTSGALLTRYPEGLISALQKISKDQTPMARASSATAHLWLESPFKNNDGKNWLAKLFMSHPPVEERVKALRGISI